MSMEKITVKVVKASRQGFWYADRIGEIFEVRTTCGEDLILYEDLSRRSGMRLIKRQDCEQLFTFTRSELEELLEKCWEAAGEWEYRSQFGKVPCQSPDKQTFITQLLNTTKQ